ncbi:MAG: helix-turn-helix transcriptional regulator [Ktedonobacteraceae bacterium]|nr:helix-turn-helix transcriptional regulator [Ktedonobacteraceae bacterium]
MDRQQRRKSRRRQEILTVVARFFAEVGYERTTFEMIANELGLSQPALYL